MTKKFIERVKREGRVDTRKYRYISDEDVRHDKYIFQIKRLPLEYLDTMAAYDEWEVVYSETLAEAQSIIEKETKIYRNFDTTEL